MDSRHLKQSLTRRDFLKLALTSGVAVALASILQGCGGPETASPSATRTRVPTATLTPTPDLAAGLESLDIDAFLEESSKRLLLRDPETLTVLGLADVYGVGNDKLTDISDTYIRQTQIMEAEILNLLSRYDQTSFTFDQALNSQIYTWALDDKVRSHPFMYHNYPVTPFIWASITYDLLFLFTDYQPLANLQDAQDYIARLSQVNTKYAQLLDALQRREAAGIVIPRLLVPEIVESLNRMIEGGATSTAFYLSFANKINSISNLTSSEKMNLRDQAKSAVKDSVIPGHRLLIDYFHSLETTAPEEVGLWQFPNGSAYYTHLLRHFTTTDATADEIHELGLQQVERIQAELRLEFDKLGYPADESIATLLQRAEEESGMVEGEEALAIVNTAIASANSIIAEVFDVQLQGELDVVGGEIGGFSSSLTPRNSSGPSIYHVLTAWPQPSLAMQTVTFHETIPGHYFQRNVARQFNLPLFREETEFDSYLDGWALYAERLVWELGVYHDDPLGNLGRLQAELLRAVRMVADTGIHAKQWTYDETFDYMEQTIGSGAEATRYVGYPAQAVSYYIGYLKILELRQRAMDTLADKFDLKEFHHVLLCNGELPLAFLEQLIDKYIASKI